MAAERIRKNSTRSYPGVKAKTERIVKVETKLSCSLGWKVESSIGKVLTLSYIAR